MGPLNARSPRHTAKSTVSLAMSFRTASKAGIFPWTSDKTAILKVNHPRRLLNQTPDGPVNAIDFCGRGTIEARGNNGPGVPEKLIRTGRNKGDEAPTCSHRP